MSTTSQQVQLVILTSVTFIPQEVEKDEKHGFCNTQ